jgi:hypothetical protein
VERVTEDRYTTGLSCAVQECDGPGRQQGRRTESGPSRQRGHHPPSREATVRAVSKGAVQAGDCPGWRRCCGSDDGGAGDGGPVDGGPYTKETV